MLTSNLLKWEGYWTLPSAQTGWRITWDGSTGFTQLKGENKKMLNLWHLLAKFSFHPPDWTFSLSNILLMPHWSPCPLWGSRLMLMMSQQAKIKSYPLMRRFHLGWVVLSSLSVAQQFSSSRDNWGFDDLVSSTSKYSGCCRYFMMG